MVKLDYLLITALSIDACIHNQQDAKLLQEDINATQTWTSIW